MDSSQAFEKGMMTKIEGEFQGIERWDKRDELGQLTTFHLELLKYNLVRDYH
jgi:hypothetical protein